MKWKQPECGIRKAGVARAECMAGGTLEHQVREERLWDDVASWVTQGAQV